jgi:hypothetical protein
MTCMCSSGRLGSSCHVKQIIAEEGKTVRESIALNSAELAQGKNRRALLDWLRYANTRWMAPPKLSGTKLPGKVTPG